MDEFYKPEVYVPPEVFTILPVLKDAGIILGVVSNREEPFQEELVKLKLDSYFQFSLAGGEVNSFKPDGVIFERALELAATSAFETMYIGDNYFADIVGSRRAGLTPVLYDPIRLFPDADCAIIKSFTELPELLSDLTQSRFDYEREHRPLSAQRELRPERSDECKPRSEVEGLGLKNTHSA